MQYTENPPEDVRERVRKLISDLGDVVDRHMVEFGSLDGLDDALNAVCSVFATTLCMAAKTDQKVFDQFPAMLSYHIFHSAQENGVTPPVFASVN